MANLFISMILYGKVEKLTDPKSQLFCNTTNALLLPLNENDYGLCILSDIKFNKSNDILEADVLVGKKYFEHTKIALINNQWQSLSSGKEIYVLPGITKRLKILENLENLNKK